MSELYSGALLDSSSPCLLPEVHTSFIATAERIRCDARDSSVVFLAPSHPTKTRSSHPRQVSRSEYLWATHWLQSWQELSRARGRAALAGMAHRLWPMLLGCPELLHPEGLGAVGGDRLPGCMKNMQIRSGSKTGAERSLKSARGSPPSSAFLHCGLHRPCAFIVMQQARLLVASFTSVTYSETPSARSLTLVDLNRHVCTCCCQKITSCFGSLGKSFSGGAATCEATAVPDEGAKGGAAYLPVALPI